MIGDNLRRGIVAGLAAGVLAGMFALLVGEIPIAEAIRLEEAGSRAGQSAASADTGAPAVDISRTTQQSLLPVATAVVGACMGGLFALAYTFARRRLRVRDEWHAALGFGAAAWAAVALFPALVYPAAPPGVGEPSTIGSRSGWYVVAVGAAVGLGIGMWAFAHVLRQRGLADVPRQVTVGTVTVLLAGLVAVLLPANTDPVETPAQLLWTFRLASIGTQTLLWAVLVVTFGWLLQRAQDERAGRTHRART